MSAQPFTVAEIAELDIGIIERLGARVLSEFPHTRTAPTSGTA